MAEQDRMARLSSNSLHRVVAGATHAALIEDEKAAGAVSRAIRDVVASVRTSRPLHWPATAAASCPLQGPTGRHRPPVVLAGIAHRCMGHRRWLRRQADSREAVSRTTENPFRRPPHSLISARVAARSSTG